ncbi:hypothetical protein Tco_1057601 [Tanacetum coccineum]|uniref:Xylulose kinase-1 n=1 Tax=Tanacetum coccineum TaxID=301880 RepID=A0ABQ5H628_9ASTR
MSDLKFADTHNLVAFLKKPTESEGFEEIVDFLNANPIKYALTVNPLIYCSCIKQFWDTVKVKTVKGEVQLQALVDKKKVIITESTIRRDLQLEDANGVDCLPNAAIFEQLTLMGYEKLSQKLTFYKAFFSPQWKFLIHIILQCVSANTTAWNEFSSTMASVIICLATNQKFNFSKYIFDNMVKNVDSMVKFWMYPRFVQVFMNKQVGDMSHHKRIYVTPSHTKKIFGNMKREGKGFSGRVTPLFQTMMVQAHEEIGEGSEIPTDPHHTPIIQPSTSQPQKKQSRRKQRKDTEIPQSSGPTEHIADETLDLENTKTAQAQEITSLKKRVKKLEKKRGLRTHKLKRLYRVGRSRRVVSSKEESLGEDMFGVNDFEGDEIVVESELADKDMNLSVDEVTLAQSLVALKSANVHEKGDVIKGPSVPVSAASTKVSTVIPTTAATTIIAVNSRPRAKGFVFHEQDQEQEQAPTPIISS